MHTRSFLHYTYTIYMIFFLFVDTNIRRFLKMDCTPSYHPFVHKILNCKQSESLIFIYIYINIIPSWKQEQETV